MTKSIKEKSDAELIQIIHARDYVVGDQAIRNEARTELHSRQKKSSRFTNVLTFLILIFTLAIFVLTLILVLKECGVQSRRSSLLKEEQKSQNANDARQNQNNQTQN